MPAGFTESRQVQQDDFAAGNDHVAIGGEAAQSIVKGGRLGCVIDINELIRDEIRVQRDADQPAFLIRLRID